MMQEITLAWVKANPEAALAMIERTVEARQEAEALAKAAAKGHREEERRRSRCEAALRVARGYVLAAVTTHSAWLGDLATIDAALAQQPADQEEVG